MGEMVLFRATEGMAMSDDEIHPLDRDYSVPLEPAKKRLTSLFRWHHIGFVTFVAGFATIIPAAIILNAFPGGWTETIGSFLHRLAMYIILIGGVLVVAAYQAPRQAAAAAKKRERRELERRSLAKTQGPTLDPTFGSLTWHEDNQIAEFSGSAIMRSGDFVSIGIEIPKDGGGIEFTKRELIDQARQTFLKIRQNQSTILASGAAEVAKTQHVELQLAINSMDLVWIRFFPAGEAQLIYDISKLFDLPWGRRMMHVNVDACGHIQEGECAFL